MLGCGIVGYGAGDLISEAVLAIEMGARSATWSTRSIPHPTLSETLGARRRSLLRHGHRSVSAEAEGVIGAATIIGFLTLPP